MRAFVARVVLRFLNSAVMNPTPGRYVFADGIDAFTADSLRSEVSQKPDITVAEVVEMADHWRACPAHQDGLSVLDGGRWRDATREEVREVKNLLTGKVTP